MNPKFVERMHAQITELLTKYGKIPLVRIDFDGYPCPSVPRESATLTAVGKSLDVPFSTPVVARKFGLTIAAPCRPAIAEFQLF